MDTMKAVRVDVCGAPEQMWRLAALRAAIEGEERSHDRREQADRVVTPATVIDRP